MVNFWFAVWTKEQLVKLVWFKCRESFDWLLSCKKQADWLLYLCMEECCSLLVDLKKSPSLSMAGVLGKSGRQSPSPGLQEKTIH